MTPPQDDQDDQDDQKPKTPNLEDIETSMEQEMNAVEEAELAVNAGFYAAQKELTELKEALARSQADYRNLLTRVDRERNEMGGYITGNIIIKILPIVDNLERAIANIPEDIAENSWVFGMRSIYTLAVKQFELVGVKSFDSVGFEVDADLHDVMSQAPGKE